MPKYKANLNLTIGEGPKENHQVVKKGDVFECTEAYADEHLEDHHAEEVEDDAPVTAHVKKAARKEAKAAKKNSKKAKA